ncbi:MATE family efflux transporter, partial [Acinetobacter baumannii]
IALAALALNLAAALLLQPILRLLQVPARVLPLIAAYLRVIFLGILATFLYNFFACLLRAVGDSAAPLWFLALSALGNVALDLWFVLGL